MSNHASSAAVSPAESLQRKHIHCPITALAFFSTSVSSVTTPSSPSKLYILSGEDTHLHIRDAINSELCASLRIFEAQPIHGISYSSVREGKGGENGNVLIWGGPYVTVLTRSSIQYLLDSATEASVARTTLQPFPILKAPDWIYHGAVSETDPSRGVLVTAHNEVLPVRITNTKSTEEAPRLEFGKLKAPRASRPILYSAQVRWTGENEILVAAGTVFGEIVVWRCCGPLGLEAEYESDEGVEVLHVFTGHEGSIFGVDISPEIAVVNDTEKKVKRLLASCSDDRTIRVWDITVATSSSPKDDQQERGLEGEDEKKKSSRYFPEARETGFGENVTNSSTPSDLEASASHISSKPLAMAMGHVSRIWNVRFAPTTTTTDEELVLYSFGEDASAQKWQLSMDALRHQLQKMEDDKAGTLIHAGTMSRHSGKHIWSSAVFAQSADYLASNERNTLIATGGSDGRISLIQDSHGGLTGSVMVTVSGAEVCKKFDPPSPNVCQDDQYQRQCHEQQEKTMREEVSNPTLETATKKKKTKGKKDIDTDHFVVYALLSSTSFLATTSTGRIFKGSLLRASSRDVKWTEIPLAREIRNDLRGYQILRGLSESPGGDMAMLASTTGRLYVYNDDGDLSVREIYQMPGKIADIFPLAKDALAGLLGITTIAEEAGCIIPVIVTTMGQPQAMRLLLFDTSTSEICQEHTIELDKGFIVTAAGYCRGHLIFGSRNGALAVYKPAAEVSTRDGEEGEGRRSFEKVAMIERPYTKDGVSSIITLPPRQGSSFGDCPYILTTSRDGRYRIYEVMTACPSLSQEDQLLQVHLRHEAVPPFGPVIEGGFFTKDEENPELILCGFRGQDFVVWNETRQAEVARVECGGAFRSFTWHVCDNRNSHNDAAKEDSGNITFIWTRASRTCIYHHSPSSRQDEQRDEHKISYRNAHANAAGITILKKGGHGREIKAVAAWGPDLLATGAEDTALRIWRVSRVSATNNHQQSPLPLSPAGQRTYTQNDQMTMECLAVVEKHTTGIQHLQWVSASTSNSTKNQDLLYLVSSSGNEELFFWRVSPLPETQYSGLAVVCEGVYTDKTRDGDLRIMGFDVEVVEEGRLCLSLVLSNSTLRTYEYYSKTDKGGGGGAFVLRAETRYTGACLMQIRHLELLTSANVNDKCQRNDLSGVQVVTASTDGHIALWKVSFPPAAAAGNKGEYTLVEVLRLHQSGIKSLALRPLASSATISPSSYLLVTGGDDNGLGFAHLTRKSPPSSTSSPSSWSRSEGQTFSITGRILVNGAHAAAITGLIITPRAKEEEEATTKSIVNVCTASNDQRVKLWRVEMGSSSGVQKVSLVANRYSAVADCGDLEALQGDNGEAGRSIVVAGVGMEMWEV